MNELSAVRANNPGLVRRTVKESSVKRLVDGLVEKKTAVLASVKTSGKSIRKTVEKTVEKRLVDGLAEKETTQKTAQKTTQETTRKTVEKNND